MSSDFSLLTLGAVAGTTLAVIGIVSLVLCILLIIANWKIFTKAGEPGWKSIIPVYNFFTECKFVFGESGGLKYFIAFIAASIASGIVSSVTGTDASNVPGAGPAILMLVIAVFLLVLEIIFLVELSRSFGYGVGFALGLIFLGGIFMLILGFGGSQYVGSKEDRASQS